MMTNSITRAMSNPEIIAELGRRFKEYRLAGKLTQKEAACLEQMDELLPEIPVSAYVLEEMKSKKPKRVRHGK